MFADSFQMVRNKSHSEWLALTGESHQVWLQSQGAQTEQMLQDLYQGWADVGVRLLAQCILAGLECQRAARS